MAPSDPSKTNSYPGKGLLLSSLDTIISTNVVVVLNQHEIENGSVRSNCRAATSPISIYSLLPPKRVDVVENEPPGESNSKSATSILVGVPSFELTDSSATTPMAPPGLGVSIGIALPPVHGSMTSLNCAQSFSVVESG